MVKKYISKEKQGLTVLTPENDFRFECRPGLDCFTRCCRNITIVLTPYDVLRMKNALNISSGDFLANYSMSMIGDAGLPVVLLKMNDNDEKNCPFVTRQGCMIYPENRFGKTGISRAAAPIISNCPIWAPRTWKTTHTIPCAF